MAQNSAVIRQRVVLVIGAGCSIPYGYTDGATLVGDVIRETRRGQPLTGTLESCGHTGASIEKFHNSLERARPASIDRFLVARPEYAEIGKQAIVALLMKLELPDRLAKAENKGDWLHYLQSKILVGKSIDEVARNDVTFVTFNFDRLIEFSLFSWLGSMYNASPTEASAAIKKFGVVHVHGLLGACKWLGDVGPLPRDYQPDNYQSEDLKVLASGLHIIGDGVQDEPTVQVRDALGSADEVCFLGFGYDPVNLGWLVECGLHRSNLRRYGSMLGMTGAETRHASAAKILLPNASWDAKQFLREHEIFHDQ